MTGTLPPLVNRVFGTLDIYRDLSTGLVKSRNPVSSVLKAARQHRRDIVELRECKTELLCLTWQKAVSMAHRQHGWSARALLKWRVTVLQKLCDAQTTKDDTFLIWSWLSAHARLYAAEEDPFDDCTPSGKPKADGALYRPYQTPCMANAMDASVLPNILRELTMVPQTFYFPSHVGSRSSTNLLRVLEKCMPGRCIVRDLATVSVKQFKDDSGTRALIALIFVVSLAGGYPHCKNRASLRTMQHIGMYWGNRAWLGSGKFDEWLLGKRSVGSESHQTLLLYVMREFLAYSIEQIVPLSRHLSKMGHLAVFHRARDQMDAIRAHIDGNVHQGRGMLYGISEIAMCSELSQKLGSPRARTPRKMPSTVSDASERRFTFWMYSTAMRIMRNALLTMPGTADAQFAKDYQFSSQAHNDEQQEALTSKCAEAHASSWTAPANLWQTIYDCVTMRNMPQELVEPLLRHINQASRESGNVKFRNERNLRRAVELIVALPCAASVLAELCTVIDYRIHLETVNCFTLPVDAVKDQAIAVKKTGACAPMIYCRYCYRVRSMVSANLPARCNYRTNVKAKFFLTGEGKIFCDGRHGHKDKSRTSKLGECAKSTPCSLRKQVSWFNLLHVGVQFRHCCVLLCTVCLQPHVPRFDRTRLDVLQCQRCRKNALALRHRCYVCDKECKSKQMSAKMNWIYVYHRRSQNNTGRRLYGCALNKRWLCDKCVHVAKKPISKAAQIGFFTA